MGCAGGRSAALTTDGPGPAAPGAGVPSLDELAQLPASPSSWISKSSSAIDGADPVAQGGGGNRVEGNTLAVIPSEGDDLAYAVYTQGGITTDKPVKVEFSLEPTTVLPSEGDDLAMEFWIGLSNYSTYRWEWLGPYTSGNLSSLKRGSMVRKGTSAAFSLPLNSEELRERYISKPDGANESRFSYVVLVTATGDPDRPNAVKIVSSQTDVSADYFPNKPHFVPVFNPVVGAGAGGGGGKGGSAVTKRASETCAFGWEDINALWPSEEPDQAESYRILRKSEGEATPQLMDTLGDSDSSWEDFSPVPGTRCTYSLVAVNSAGETAPSALEPVEFTIEPPAELRTEYIGNVGTRILWAASAGAVDYDVYARRYDESVPTFMHSSNRLTEFLHQPTGADLGAVFYYSVVAKGESVDSVASAEVRGCAPNRIAGDGFIDMTIGGVQILFDRVPAGTLMLGSAPGEFGRDDNYEGAYQAVDIADAYYISETEVPNKMFAAFVNDPNGYASNSTGIWSDGGLAWRNAGGFAAPPYWGDPAHNADPVTQPEYPVQDLSWYEARAFANWMRSEYLKLSPPPLAGAFIDLPTEVQWEYAAEGPTEQGEYWLYPWCELRAFNGDGSNGAFNDGDDGLDMTLCNSGANIGFDIYNSATAEVFKFTLGRSWCGAVNLAGNVAEWTRDEFRTSYPDPWTPSTVAGGDPLVVRGGNFQNMGAFQRTSHREQRDIDSRGDGTMPVGSAGAGIRLVLLP